MSGHCPVKPPPKSQVSSSARKEINENSVENEENTTDNKAIVNSPTLKKDDGIKRGCVAERAQDTTNENEANSSSKSSESENNLVTSKENSTTNEIKKADRCERKGGERGGAGGRKCVKGEDIKVNTTTKSRHDYDATEENENEIQQKKTTRGGNFENTESHTIEGKCARVPPTGEDEGAKRGKGAHGGSKHN